MVLDLKFSIGTLGLAFGTLCSSFYGMNLKNFIEETDFGFAAVTGSCFVASGLVCALAMTKLRKLQRVRMYNEGGNDFSNTCAVPGVGGAKYHSRSMTGKQWSSVDPLWRGLPGETRAERMRRLKFYADRGSGSGNAATAATEGDIHGDDLIFTPSPQTSPAAPTSPSSSSSSPSL